MAIPEHPKVLIVEDDGAERNALSELLRSHHYVIEVASDGADALAKVEAFEPEIILLDLNMPQMDGLELLRQLQQHQFSRIPVIVMSKFGNIDEAVAIVHSIRRSGLWRNH